MIAHSVRLEDIQNGFDIVGEAQVLFKIVDLL